LIDVPPFKRTPDALGGGLNAILGADIKIIESPAKFFSTSQRSLLGELMTSLAGV